MTRYVILGAGAAGIAAAETIRARDGSGEIMCVSAEPAGYYSRPGLAYYLSKELGRKSLFPFSKDDFEQRGIKLYINTAVQIDVENREVIFRDQKRVRYDRLLLALGGQAVRPDVEGANLEGVVYLDSIAQTDWMIKKARRARRAVVVGGGITALEIVEGLQARGVKVHFFLRGEQYWGRVLDGIESRLVLNRLMVEGVVIHQRTELDRVIEKRGKVSAVLTKDGREIRTDLVAFAIGVQPRKQLAVDSGLEVSRGIRVNEYLETSAQGVYAAGDAAEMYDPSADKWVVDSLWYLARNQGIVAGGNMTGEKTAYLRGSPLNVTRLAGLTTTIIGRVGSAVPEEDQFSIVRGESETWHQMPDAVVCQNNFEINRLRIMVGTEKIIGAVLMGDQSLSQPLEELVAGQVDISPIRSQLVNPGADLGEILLKFWNQWRNTDAH
jgi:NAD(P)H-nitrite reductase large subunit